jgi:hypothetical protein
MTLTTLTAMATGMGATRSSRREAEATSTGARSASTGDDLAASYTAA